LEGIYIWTIKDEKNNVKIVLTGMVLTYFDGVAKAASAVLQPKVQPGNFNPSIVFG